MDFQAYNKILICNDNIHNVVVGDTAIGYEFCIKYPSYRGTFLSCIEKMSFFIDGIEIPADSIRFQLNGKEFLLEEISQCFKDYWFVRDKAVVRVMKQGGINPGEHTLRVYMEHRVPYTGYFGQYLILTSDVTETKSAE